MCFSQSLLPKLFCLRCLCLEAQDIIRTPILFNFQRFPVHVMESVSTMRARQTMANEIIEQVGTNTNFLKAEGRNMCFLHLLQIQNDLCGGRNLGVFLVVEVDL